MRGDRVRAHTADGGGCTRGPRDPHRRRVRAERPPRWPLRRRAARRVPRLVVGARFRPRAAGRRREPARARVPAGARLPARARASGGDGDGGRPRAADGIRARWPDPADRHARLRVAAQALAPRARGRRRSPRDVGSGSDVVIRRLLLLGALAWIARWATLEAAARLAGRPGRPPPPP